MFVASYCYWVPRRRVGVARCNTVIEHPWGSEAVREGRVRLGRVPLFGRVAQGDLL